MKQPICLAGLLVLFTVIASPAVGQGLGLSDTGIRFEDGTMLTSAWGRGFGYENVLVVAKSGGQFTSIQAALDAIGGTGPYGIPLPEATEVNPYLVWVAPGIYEEHVVMKSWVDVEGAGRRLTILRSPGGGQPYDRTVIGASNSRLRSLTIENAFGGQVLNASTPRLPMWLEETEVIASEGGVGILAGDPFGGGDLSLSHVTVRVTGGSATTGIAVGGTLIVHEVLVTARAGTLGNTAISAVRSGLVGSGLEARARGEAAYALDCYEACHGWPGEHLGAPITFEGIVHNLLWLSRATINGDLVITMQTDDPAFIMDSYLGGDLVLEDDRASVNVVDSLLAGLAQGAQEQFRCMSVHDGGLNLLDEHCQPVP